MLQGKVDSTSNNFVWNELTKNELGYDYKMHYYTYAGIVGYENATMEGYIDWLKENNKLEWFEQMDVLADYILKNGVDSVVVNENDKFENVAGVTVSNYGYVDLVKEAIQNAKDGKLIALTPTGSDLVIATAEITSKGKLKNATLDMLQGKVDSESGKFIWNDDDPMSGIDVPVWIQHVHEADCSDDECDDYCAKYYNGFFVNGVKKHVCYSYDIIDGICVVIAFDKVRNEFKYVGGCFEGGKNYMMVPAKMNEIYYFSGIEIEVRDKSDPIIKAGELSDYSYSFGNSWRYIAYFLFLVLFANIGFLIYIIVDIVLTKKKINEGINIDGGLRDEEAE
jgi:hypothetical protein